MIPQKQLSLADNFENCKNIFDDDRLKFLDLLEEHIDLVPQSPIIAGIFCCCIQITIFMLHFTGNDVIFMIASYFSL